MIIGVPLLIKNLLPGIEGFPYKSAFTSTSWDRKGDLIYFSFQFRVFHYYNVLPVTGGQVPDIVLQIGQRSMPFRIIGQAYHIERHLPGQHIVHKKTGFVVLPSQSYVQHDRYSRANGLYAGYTGIDQLRQVIQIADRAIGPDHTMVDLIAYLNHIGLRALLFQCEDHLFRIFKYQLPETGNIRVLPA